MKSGAEYVAQAALANGQWGGRADFLMKTDQPSELGNWSYEVADTKLAQNTRAGTDILRNERKWRHLDGCQFKTILHASVPPVKCGKHGVKQVNVPWAEKMLTAVKKCGAWR